MVMGGTKMIDYGLKDILIQYSLLAIPFAIVVFGYVLMKLSMGDKL